MIRRDLLLFLALAACAPLGRGGGYRDSAAQISSRATIDWTRMAGNWTTVGSFGQDGPWANGDQIDLAWQNPGSGRLTRSGPAGRDARPIAVSGPGRFRASGIAADPRPFWVLWVDESYRTAVVGTPDGSFGYVLNRDASPPADRLEAARRVLDFNGYDLARLQVL